MMNSSIQPARELRKFDYGIVAPKMQGLFFNLNSDLEKRKIEAERGQDQVADMSLNILSLILRFAWNSYETVLYLAGDIPEDPRRKPNYVLVVPNINRQLLDLLFSLVYMLDDLRLRAVAFERAGWRDLQEEYETFKDTFGDDPEWQNYLNNMANMLAQMVDRYKITPEEQANLDLVDYWPTPYTLIKKHKKTPMKCGEFLKYLEKWLYRDTSAQSHMKFAGLLKVAPFMIAPLIGREEVKKVNDVPMRIFHFTQVSRTAISFLAIATEIDTYCHFGNRESINFLWVIFSEYVAEAREMYDLRYRDRQP